MNSIYGIPILVKQMPQHKKIASDLTDYLEKDAFFSNVSTWKCNVESTFAKDNNFDIPWDSFIESSIEVFKEYLDYFPIDKKFEIEIYAWMNRYKQGNYQEIHNHSGNGATLSCAYMLELPDDSGDFTFFQSGNEFYNSPLKQLCNENFPYNNRFTPDLNEGDIVIFPSFLDHFVTANVSNKRRSTISANLYVKPIYD